MHEVSADTRQTYVDSKLNKPLSQSKAAVLGVKYQPQ